MPTPGVAEHRQEMALAALDDLLEGVEERAELLLAVDERRVEAARPAGRVRPHLDEGVRVERLAAFDAACEIGSTTTASRTSRCVASLIRISSAAAASSKRFAAVTAGPSR